MTPQQAMKATALDLYQRPRSKIASRAQITLEACEKHVKDVVDMLPSKPITPRQRQTLVAYMGHLNEG